MTPYIVINLFTSTSQTCVCNLDKYYIRPVLEQHKDPRIQLEFVLNEFLLHHKNTPFRPMGKHDETNYYTQDIYGKHHLSIYDVIWNINIPFYDDMDEETKENVWEILYPLYEMFDKLGLMHRTSF